MPFFSFRGKTSYPYLSGYTWISCCDWKMLNTDYGNGPVRFNAEGVKRGDTIFVDYNCLKDFIQRILPKIRERVVLVTANYGYGADHPMPGPFEDLLEEEKVGAWFVQNIDRAPSPKLIPIPVGAANSCWPHGDIELLKQGETLSREKEERSIFCYLNYTPLPNRADCTAHFRELGVPFTKRVSFKDYLQDLGESVFVPSPPGNGADCHRTWEALLLGCYPIVKSSALNPLYRELPVVVVEDWAEAIPPFLEAKREEFERQTFSRDKLYAPFWLEELRRCALLCFFLVAAVIWGESPRTAFHEFPTPFCYFENLYFKEENSTFITLGDLNAFPGKAITLSDPRGYFFKSQKDPLEGALPVEGTTLFLFEMDRTICCSYHFFHILEHIVGHWAFYGNEHFSDVKQIVLASAGEKEWAIAGTVWPVVWPGPNEINKHLLRALFPNAEVKTWLQFLDEYRGKTVCFERALTSDRGIAETRPESGNLGRMLGFSRRYFSRDALERMAERVYAYAGTRIEQSPFLRVTYLKRPLPRALAPELEEMLLASIQTMRDVALRVEDFAKLSFQEQIRVIGNTDVLISVHGNGLSHVLFLPPSAKVIEIFPPSTHTVDYRIFAEARGLDYRCIMSDRGFISKETSYQLGMFGNFAGTIHDLDLSLVLNQIRE